MIIFHFFTLPAVGISWGGITRAPTLLESDSLPGLTTNSIHDSGRVHPAPKPFVDEPYTARLEPVTLPLLAFRSVVRASHRSTTVKSLGNISIKTGCL